MNSIKVLFLGAFLSLFLIGFNRLEVNAQEQCEIKISDVSLESFSEKASSSETTTITSEDGIISIKPGSLQKIPNYFLLECVVDGGSDDIKFIAHNIGIDSIDKIQCTVKITDTGGLVQYNKIITFTNILPIFSPTHKVYVKNWKKIEITGIQAWDGTDYATRPNHTIIRE